MVPPSRRALLRKAGSLAAGGFAVGAAGCLASIDELPGDEPTPPGVYTPDGGECEDGIRPEPPTTPPQAEPATYPEYPSEITEDALESFLRSFESAYKRNELIAEADQHGNCLANLDVAIEDVSVESLGPGYRATVDWFASYKGEHCSTPTGSATPTPLPYADIPGSTDYYAREAFLVRDSTVVVCR